MQKSTDAKYGLLVVADVSFCQPVYTVGKVVVSGGGVEPAVSDASSVAAGWLASSSRQKSAAFGADGPLAFAVPSVR